MAIEYKFAIQFTIQMSDKEDIIFHILVTVHLFGLWICPLNLIQILNVHNFCITYALECRQLESLTLLYSTRYILLSDRKRSLLSTLYVLWPGGSWTNNSCQGALEQIVTHSIIIICPLQNEFLTFSIGLPAWQNCPTYVAVMEDSSITCIIWAQEIASWITVSIF